MSPQAKAETAVLEAIAALARKLINLTGNGNAAEIAATSLAMMHAGSVLSNLRNSIHFEEQ